MLQENLLLISIATNSRIDLKTLSTAAASKLLIASPCLEM